LKKIAGFILGSYLLFLTVKGAAQDIQFGQLYTNSLYLNPAMVGIAPYSRAMFHHRTQWNQLDARYMSYMAGGDHFISRYHSGLGGYVLYDQQGQSILNSYEANLQYAYEAVLTEKLVARLGLQAGLVSRVLDYSSLLFPDQLDQNGSIGATQANTGGIQRIWYPDLSSGAMVYTDKFWMGVAAHHLNRPNQSFIGDESRLPVKFSMNGGYKIVIKNTKRYRLSVTPSLYYKLQGKSDQLDLGLYGIAHPFLVGIWYRGLPLIKKYRSGLQNNESVIVMLGYKFERIQLTYSYDFTVSKLAKAGTGGVHEISVVYCFKRDASKRPMKLLPCPDFTEE